MMPTFSPILEELMRERRPKETARLEKEGRLEDLLEDVEDSLISQVLNEVHRRTNNRGLPWPKKLSLVNATANSMKRQLLDDLNAMVTPESSETSASETSLLDRLVQGDGEPRPDRT